MTTPIELVKVSFLLTLACHSNCYDCYGPSNSQCTFCKNSYLHALTNECLTTCPDGFYGNDFTFTC